VSKPWKTALLLSYPDQDAMFRVLVGTASGDSIASFVKEEVMDSVSEEDAIKRLESAIADLQVMLQDYRKELTR
jgi:hypothetical protein